MGKKRPEVARPDRFRWIVDGHNMIFAVAEWHALQVSGERREARDRLEASLERFGRAIGRQIWVVFDGNELDRNPDACDRPHLKTFYSRAPEEADDRIRRLAESSVRAGEPPVVVSSDARTLLNRLSSGVRSVKVEDFWRSVYRRAVESPEKWSPGDMDDIERHFLENSPFAEDRDSLTETSSADDDPSSAGDRTSGK